MNNSIFKVGDKVMVHGRIDAKVAEALDGNKYLVWYSDGKGSDYMPAECLTLKNLPEGN
jgi:hypothetical protein